MPAITFKATLQAPDTAVSTNSQAIILLPKAASDKLPSRGMTITEGTLNDTPIRIVMQPDGKGSHWFTLSEAAQKATKTTVGDNITISIIPTKTWPEPTITNSVKKALAKDEEARAMWEDITPMARWDWMNWMGSVKLPKTLQERPEKLCSMLKAGKRRPCCFNRAMMMTPTSAELL